MQDFTAESPVPQLRTAFFSTLRQWVVPKCMCSNFLSASNQKSLSWDKSGRGCKFLGTDGLRLARPCLVHLRNQHLSLCPCSWQAHPDVSALLGVLQYLAVSLPKTAILENVMGIKVKDEHSDAAPIDWVLQRVQKLGYCTATTEVDLSLFHGCVRKRSSLD